MSSTSNSGSATTTTLYGQLQPPALNATALVGGSSRASAVKAQSGYNTELLKDFAEKGTCKVNGKAVSFSLNTGDSSFKVTGLEPFGAYEIRFDLASLSLRATKPYTGTQMNMGTVNLTSTAKSLIYEAYNAKISQIQDYDILDEFCASLATKLAVWLADAGMTPATFEEGVEDALADITSQHTLDKISRFTGNDMSGTWTGQGTLYTKTLDGTTVGHRATVNLTLHVERSTDKLTGYVNVEVVSSTKVNDNGMIPVSGKRDFTATVDKEGEFSFEAVNSSRTPVERWKFVLDATDALVCTVVSLHPQGYQSGADNLPKLRQQ
ncbi:MAG TPA: hypothetical protein PLU72_04080 [Candidatus Ozemobacteraceae bacterium]|nr:hypothetical protein [Candidatus Ozemobacteraceae bacterium]HQG28538.1 hypothetical protein [Candidatus Ozemobacteraceae bacterium]